MKKAPQRANAEGPGVTVAEKVALLSRPRALRERGEVTILDGLWLEVAAAILEKEAIWLVQANGHGPLGSENMRAFGSDVANMYARIFDRIQVSSRTR
jgi:hypothetical protein